MTEKGVENNAVRSIFEPMKEGVTEGRRNKLNT
jgi:hypothetical protein